MKKISLKHPNILISISKTKLSLTPFQIIIITAFINIPSIILINAFSMFQSLLKQPLIEISIGKIINPGPMFLTIKKITFINRSITILINSEAIQVVIAILSLIIGCVYLTLRKQITRPYSLDQHLLSRISKSLSTGISLIKLRDINENPALPMLYIPSPVPLKNHSLLISLPAPTLLNPTLPISLINPPISRIVNALTMFLTLVKITFITLTILINVYTVSLELVVMPIT